MKKHLFSLALFMSALDLFAQADLPSYGYSYQAIVRDDKGEPAVNQVVQLRFQILNSTNQKLYEETHAATTDGFGRVDMVLGSGMAASGEFDTINWGVRKHFLDIAIKMNGITEWTSFGKKEVLLQPFAKGNRDFINLGDSMLYTPKKIGIGDKNNAPPEAILQVLNPQKPTTIMIGNYGNGGTNIRMSTTAWQNGAGEIQVVSAEGKDWGKMSLNPNGGNVRIGGSDPNGQLDVKGQLNVDVTSNNGPNGRNAINIYASPDNNIGIIQVNKPGFVLWNSIDQTYADLSVKTLTIHGSDRTHRFNTTTGTQLPAGTVVVFDETQPGKIRPCAKAYDRNIPGIISDESGKGKYHPGIIHEQEDTKNGSPVALDGTVEAFAVGPIAVGDYLTTSKVPGHAMRTKNRRKSEGAEIGRALTPLAKGKKGKVEVFVGRD